MSAREKLREMSYGYIPAQLVYVAAVLGLADFLKDKPKGYEELAEASGAHAPSLLRALRGMVDLGLFERDEEGRFHLTPLSELLRSDVPDSRRWSAMLHGGELTWRPWGELLHSVRTGETAFEHALGVPLFEYLTRHPEINATFYRATRAASTTRFTEEVTDSLDLDNVSKIVDVGGGDGVLLDVFLRACTEATGVLFDLPHAIAEVRERLPADPVAERRELVEGDFFEGVPEGDLYLLSNILHDWDDERCVEILHNCNRAITYDGRLLIFEYVLGEDRPVDPSGLRPEIHSDIDMLVTTGGCERTEEEYLMLLEKAGFVLAGRIQNPEGAMCWWQA